MEPTGQISDSFFEMKSVVFAFLALLALTVYAEVSTCIRCTSDQIACSDTALLLFFRFAARNYCSALFLMGMRFHLSSLAVSIG